MNRWALTLTVLVAALVGTSEACGGSSEPDSSPTQSATGTAPPSTTTTPSPTEPPTLTEVSWADLLAHVPETPLTLRAEAVLINDYARVREAFGISRPATDATADELEEYARQIRFVESDVSRGLAAPGTIIVTDQDELRSELGYSLADVDAELTDGAGDLWLRRGRFDTGRIDKAVQSDPVFRSLLEEVSYRGADYYAWGEHDPDRASVAHPLSDHGLAIVNDYMYWAQHNSAGLERMIDAGLGGVPTLGDLESYQLLAAGLDRLNPYTAFMSDHVLDLRSRVCIFDCTDDKIAELIEGVSDQPLLLPYSAFAMGAGADSTGVYIAIVLYHEDEETARDNVTRLADQLEIGRSLNFPEDVTWDEYFDLTSASPEIWSEGRLVLGKVYTNAPASWLQAVFKRDMFLAHE